jgi:hypothetical protein
MGKPTGNIASVVPEITKNENRETSTTQKMLLKVLSPLSVG